jgi:RNA polymerase sigma factor for flagellar operon FliA
VSQRCVANTDPRIPKVLDRVRRMARSMARSLPANVQLEDMVAAGNMGVATALARFNGPPETFEAFAMKHARGAMLDDLRRLDTMSRLGRRQARRATATAAKLASRLGRPPEETEVAAELQMGLAAYRDLVLMRSTILIEGGFERLDAGTVPADQQVDARRAERRLSTEIGRLPERHAIVLSLSFEHDETLQSIAKTLGVSVARAHQIRVTALDRLRRCCVAKTFDRVCPTPRPTTGTSRTSNACPVVAFVRERNPGHERVARFDRNVRTA